MKIISSVIVLASINCLLAMESNTKMEFKVATLQEIEKSISFTYEFTIKPFTKNTLNEKGLKSYFSYFSYPFLNVVLQTNLSDLSLSESIKRVISLADQGTVTWWKTPSTSPKNLTNLLKENGFSFLGINAAMVYYPFNTKLITSSEVNSDKIIKHVSSLSDLDNFINIRLVGAGFAAKEVVEHYSRALKNKSLVNDVIAERYLGYYNNIPVTCATLIIKGNWGGICEVATLPNARKNGMATLLTNHLIARSKELNLDYIVLFSSQAAQNIYAKSGFVKAFDIESYIYSK